jgi:tryptophan synthase alpha chain
VSLLAKKIESAKEEGRSALIAYLPVGYPDVDASIEAMVAAVEGGADVMEIGVPYSDPGMDGPVIQQAVDVAVRAGVGMRDVLTAVEAVAATGAVPVVMTYWNPVERYGVDRFAADLAAAGGAGAITPDLIPDEAQPWLAASDAHGLDRVFLVAPSSTAERMQRTVDASRGFVYAVSIMGVTGARTSVSTAAKDVVAAAHAAGAERVCVGLGVSTADQVREIAAYAEGVIVGTALVAALRDGGVDAVGALTEDLSTGLTREPGLTQETGA